MEYYLFQKSPRLEEEGNSGRQNNSGVWGNNSGGWKRFLALGKKIWALGKKF